MNETPPVGCSLFRSHSQVVLIAGMRAPDRLAQLHLVAQQNQVRGRRSHPDHVGERDLPSLVDKQINELALRVGMAEDPGCTANEIGQSLTLKSRAILRNDL